MVSEPDETETGDAEQPSTLTVEPRQSAPSGQMRARLCIHASAPDGRSVDITSSHDLHPEATLEHATRHLADWARKLQNGPVFQVHEVWIEIPVEIGDDPC